MRHTQTINAEVRAIDSGRHAFVNDDGSFRVKSISTPRLWHRITFEAVFKNGSWLVRFGCSCPAGQNRPYNPVPCFHAALVGRRLERMGWARWIDGLWFATDVAMDAAMGITSEKG